MNQQTFYTDCFSFICFLIFIFHTFLDPNSQLIGEGANGKVYKYFNAKNKKIEPVALKQLPFSSVDDSLVAELYLAPKLHSQYIVPIYFSFFDNYHDGELTASIVMEYCASGSLTSLKTDVGTFFVRLFSIFYTCPPRKK